MRHLALATLLAIALLFTPGKAAACPPGSFVIDQFGNPQFVPAVSTFSSGFNSLGLGGFGRFGAIGGRGLGARGLGGRALGGRAIGGRRR
jgi:hypothetical protein